MCKLVLPTNGTGIIRRSFRHLSLTIFIVGLLAFSAGVFGTTAVASEDEELQASLSELLFKAVTANDINAVRTVVEAGADLTRVNLRGQTAMDIAVDRSLFDIAEYLVFARRLEQEKTRKSAPPVATIQQSSPEAAPVVESAPAERPAVVPVTVPVTPQKQAPKSQTQTNIETPGKAPTYAELMNEVKRLAAVAESMANKSQPEPTLTPRKATAPTAEATPEIVEIAKAEPAQKPQEPTDGKIRSEGPIYIIGSNGRLVEATPAQIQQVQQITKRKAVSSEPDIEPRRSFFIPKPRHKPDYRPVAIARAPQPVQNVEEGSSAISPPQALPTSRIPKTSTPRVPVPPFAKPRIPRISDGTAPQTVNIRPTRRIPPQLLEKLRRKLRTSDRRNETVSELTIDKPTNVLDAPVLTPPSLPRSVEVTPLPAVGTPTKINVAASKPNNAEKTPTESALKNTTETKSASDPVTKLLNGLGNLLGFSSEPDAPAPAPEEINANIQDETPEVEIVAVPPKAARTPVPVRSTPIAIPQNSVTGFETHKVTSIARSPALPIVAAPKPQPVEVATTSPQPIVSPRIEIPTKPVRSPMPTPRVKSPSVMDSVKEVLLPGVIEPPKVDRSISNTATDKAKESEFRRITRAMPLNRLRKPLKNVLLTLGDSVTTGQTKLPRGIAEPDACVRKRRGAIVFCVVPVDWPRFIEPAFAVNTSLYQGTRAIARYDKNRATHFHSLFASADHDKIIEFMKKRYGPPTDIWKRMIAPFGQPRQPNPTYVWRSLDTESDQVTILEVRKYDDSREVFPDTNHGAIRLYPAGGPPVFPIITAHDIMSIDWAARSDHIDGASPALARTIRVQP